MSSGPGKVERAIRAVIEKEQADGRYVSLATDDLYRAVFGSGPWTKSQRVSVLRAMHRVMAREPGWTREREQEPAFEDDPAQHWIVFRWDRRRSGAKPQMAHEPVLAYRSGGRDGWRLIWEPATIVSRGGSRSANRVTVEYAGQKVQCTELSDGRLRYRSSGVIDVLGFCHERAREKVEAEHQRTRLVYASPTTSRRPDAIEEDAPPLTVTPLN